METNASDGKPMRSKTEGSDSDQMSLCEKSTVTNFRQQNGHGNYPKCTNTYKSELKDEDVCPTKRWTWNVRKEQTIQSSSPPSMAILGAYWTQGAYHPGQVLHHRATPRPSHLPINTVFWQLFLSYQVGPKTYKALNLPCWLQVSIPLGSNILIEKNSFQMTSEHHPYRTLQSHTVEMAAHSRVRK